MSDHDNHGDDCSFKFGTLDVCNCMEKNMLDRIKALTKERDEAIRAERQTYRDAVEISARAEAAEAKLAMVEALMDAGFAEYERRLTKAVETLEFYATQDVTYPNVGTVTFHGHDDNGQKARATLAEIKGESHE